MDSSLTQDPRPSAGRLGSPTLLIHRRLTPFTAQESLPENSFPVFQEQKATNAVAEMLLLKSETEAVIKSKEWNGRETYIREKANQLTCQLFPCR